MTEQQAEKAVALLDELKELKKIDKLLQDRKHGNSVNVRFHQHYGDCHDYERVAVDKRHLPKFLTALREVIREVEHEFDKL
jgi:hypothetical protein